MQQSVTPCLYTLHLTPTSGSAAKKNMGIETQIQLFDNAKIRVAWDDEKEKYFFSVVDVLHVLTDSANPQTYWRVLKKRLLDEGNETVTNCNQLKLPASDGKMRLTDVADLEGILRIVQSVPRI